MKQNNNPHEVVLSREVYDELILRATWEGYPGTHLKWHARKFNPALKAERKAELIAERAETVAQKKAVREFLELHLNEIVFYRISHPQGWTLIPCFPRYIGRGKTTVGCKGVNLVFGKVVYKDHKVSDLVLRDDIPSTAVPTGTNYFVPFNKSEVYALDGGLLEFLGEWAKGAVSENKDGVKQDPQE